MVSMKKFVVKSIVLGLWALACVATAQASEMVNENHAERAASSTVKVLVVGLDHVHSNYYPGSMITEETGIPEDSLSETYNRIITDNIILSNKDKKFAFISAEQFSDAKQLVGDPEICGEDEESYVDINQINRQNYSRLVDEVDADYVLFLNQHYLKWQEKPLRTLFHFVSFSLFDKDQQEVTKGNHYFTCMNLETADKLSKASRKSSSKIASKVIKSIDK